MVVKPVTLVYTHFFPVGNASERLRERLFSREEWLSNAQGRGLCEANAGHAPRGIMCWGRGIVRLWHWREIGALAQALLVGKGASNSYSNFLGAPDPQMHNVISTADWRRTWILNLVCILKTHGFKFTRGLEPLYGDARIAKSFEVLTLLFSTDCSPIDWLQSALKIRRFENVFLFFLFWKSGVTFAGGKIGLVWCLSWSCWSESVLWQEELFCIANHPASSQFFGDRISAPCPQHAVVPRRAQKQTSAGPYWMCF
jgi:hypothetical protein